MLLEEDFHRCSECGCAEFVERKLLTINKYAGTKYKRQIESLPISQNLTETKIVYECSKCGLRLDI